MRLHPITNMPLEDGIGHLPDDQQAMLLHIPYIEATEGKAVADAMRARMNAFEMEEKAEHMMEAAAPVEAAPPLS